MACLAAFPKEVSQDLSSLSCILTISLKILNPMACYSQMTPKYLNTSSREDSVTLQADINSVESWSITWLLTFHPDKCHVLTIRKFTNIRHTHRYKVYGKELEHVFAEKDLGVVIDGDLNFEEHMSEKINKVNAVMGMIRRTFSFLDCHLFKKLHTTFVRHHLEYAHPVWSPHLTH